MVTYFPQTEVEAALRKCKALAFARGKQAGRDEATQFVQWAAQLNGSTHAVLKALGTDPAPRFTMPEADEGEPDHAEVVTLALIDALLEAKTHHPETQGGPVYDYLLGLLKRPDDDVRRKAIINGKEKYGCLMADLPSEVGDHLIALGRLIPDSDLGEDGREDEPHVTVRYGFHDEVTTAAIASVVETWEEPLRVRLDHPECFYGKDSGKPYDVIVFAIDSEQLHYLHDALGDLPHTDTHSTYRPHATVAYVKAGLGDEWLKKMELPLGAVRSAVVNSLVYSDPYKTKTTIEIGNQPILKAFQEDKHPRDDGGRFVSKEAIHAAKSDPKKAEALRERVTDPEQRKKLDAAIAGETDLGRTKAGEKKEATAKTREEKATRLNRARELANEISMARRGGAPVPPEHFAELAEHLPHMTVADLRSTRVKLAASFGGGRKRDEMVAKLTAHAKQRAEELNAPEEEPTASVKKEAWEHTPEEWDALSDSDRYSHPSEPGGPSPSNSNYHQLMTLQAIESGKPVPQHVKDALAEDMGTDVHVKQAEESSAFWAQRKAEGKWTPYDDEPTEKPASADEPLDFSMFDVEGEKDDPRAKEPVDELQGRNRKRELLNTLDAVDKTGEGELPSDVVKRVEGELPPALEALRDGSPDDIEANKGKLDRHDAIEAAARGTFGPEVKAAVLRALEWDRYQGSIAKKHAAVGEELRKLKQPSGESSNNAPPDAAPAAEPSLPIGTATDVERKDDPQSPLDITPDNVDGVWKKNQSAIMANDQSLTESQAGSLAAARILNGVGNAAEEYIAGIDKRVRDGGDVSDEEDAKYVAAQTARKNLHHKLATISGYRPHEIADDHAEARKPIEMGGGHKPGDVHDLPALGNRMPIKAKFFPGRTPGEIGVGYHDDAKAQAYMPQESAKHFVNDLKGIVDVPANSGNTVVDAIAGGRGEILGKGEDGVSFSVGDKVAKVSTTVPFQPFNRGHRTPEEASERLEGQVAVNNALADKGISGILKQSLVKHGDKAFAIRDKLEIPDSLTPEQVAKVRKTLDGIHAAGYVVGDQIQVGVKNGEPYIYDLGNAQKLRSQEDVRDDNSRFESFAEQVSKKPNHDNPAPAIASQNSIDENVRDKADRVAVAKKFRDTGKLSASEADAFIGGDTQLTAGNAKWKMERAGEALGLTPEQVAHAIANTKPSGTMKKPGRKPTPTYQGSDFLRTLGMVDEPGKVPTKAPKEPLFSPEQAIKVAADDVSKLRKPDVFRAVEWAPPEHRAAVVDHIAKNRPDLHEELNDVASELGVSKPQSSGTTTTFSDADFENGNMHEKKVGNARLQYGVNENTGRAELYSLRVPQKERGKGSAKQAMKEFLSEADRRGLPVELLASPLDKRTSLGKLVRFYESLGFKVVGRGNPAGDPKMIRQPSGGQSEAV